MSLQTSCPSCNKVFTLPDDLFGKRIKCKNCGGVFRVGGGEVAPTSDSFDSLAASAATQTEMQAQPDTGTERKMPGARRVEGMFPTQIEGMTNVPPAPDAYFGDQTESDLTSSDTHTDTISSGDTVSDAIPGAMALDQTATGMEETTSLPDDPSGLAPDVPSSGDTVSDAVPPANAADLPPTMSEAAPEVPEEDEADAKKPKLPGKGKLPAKGKLPGKKETKPLDKKPPLPGKGKLPAGRKASEAPAGTKKSGSKLPILLFVPLLLLIVGAALVLYVPQVREALKLNDNEMVNQIAAKVGAPVTNKKPDIAKNDEQPQPDQPKPDEPKPDQPKPDEPKPDQPKPDQPKPDQPKPDEPKPDQPKPDEPKPDKPKHTEYAETGYEHLRAGKKGYWAAMETNSVMGGFKQRFVQRYIFDRIEGNKAFLILENWTYATGTPSVSETEFGPLPLKVNPKDEPPPPDPDTQVEKGDETITLLGKEWRCKWVQTTTTKDGKTTVVKMWKAIDRSSNASIGVAGGGTGMIKMEWRSGDDTMMTELIAIGSDTDEFKPPTGKPKPDQPKPDEPKPDDGMIEVKIEGAKWLRNLNAGDWVLTMTNMKVSGFEMKSFTRWVFDRLDGDEAVLYSESISEGQEPFKGPEMRISTVDKVERVKKPEGEPVKPLTGEETLRLGGRDFACMWTETEASGTTTRIWQVKDKTDPSMIGLAGGGWGYVKMTSKGDSSDMVTETLGWGSGAEDWKAKMPGASVETPEPDTPKPDTPKPEDDMVEVRKVSPYKHLANLDPGDWVIMKETQKGHLLDDTVYHLIKFRTLDGEIAVLSVESTTYATGKRPKTEYQELRLNTADEVKKYKRGEEPAPEEQPETSEEPLTIGDRDIPCLLMQWKENDESWKVWKIKKPTNALGLAGRGKFVGHGAVQLEIRAGEVRYNVSVHSYGDRLEEPRVPEPSVEQPKPDEPKPDVPKPDEPKPEDEWVEQTIPGATWLANCKRGDWVIMRSETKGIGYESVSFIRCVFDRIDGDEAVLNMEMYMQDGTALPGTPARVRVKDKIERIKKSEIKEPPKSTTGEETLSLGGREFLCEWTEMTTDGGYLVKSWTVKDKTDPRMIGLANGGWAIVQSTMHGESSGTDSKSVLVAFGADSDDYKAHLPKKPVVEQPKPDEPKPDVPKPDEPKPDKPVVEQPKPDQPKPDEPKLPEPKVEKPDQPVGIPETKWPAYKPKKPVEEKFGKPTDYFSEDFSNPKYDWSWLPAGVRLNKGAPGVPGAIELDANATLRFSGNVSDCELRMTIWRDMTDADREKTGNDCKGYEVLLRSSSATEYIALQVRADGYFRIIKVSGSTAKTLVGDSKGGYLAIPRYNKNADYDTVVITLRKEFVAATFNGYQLGSSSEAGGGSGNVAIRTFNGLAAAIERLEVSE